MPSTRTLIAGVAVVLVLAGCNGLVPSPAPTPTQEPTADPSSPPSDTPEPGAYPPGMNESGVTDPVALLTASARAVSNDSVRTTWTRREIHPNGTVAQTSGWTVHTGPGTDGYRLQGWVRGSSVGSPVSRTLNVSHWSNGSVTAVRSSEGGEVDYDYFDERRPLPVDRYGQVRERLQSMETRTTGVTDDEVVRVHVVGTGFLDPTGPTTYYENESLETFELSVSENGTISSFRLAFTATRGDQPVTVVTEFRLDYVADAPDRPAWVDDARDRSSGGE